MIGNCRTGDSREFWVTGVWSYNFITYSPQTTQFITKTLNILNKFNRLSIIHFCNISHGH